LQHSASLNNYSVEVGKWPQSPFESVLSHAMFQSPSSASPSNAITSTSSSPDYLVIGVPTLPLNSTTRKLSFPSGVKRLWFDVGSHKEAMYTLPSLRDQEDLAVIAFEPMYDMWGQLALQRHHDRLFAVPAAVSLDNGYAPFRRAGTDMCSSLKAAAEGADQYRWPGGCTGTSFYFGVPIIRLETILELLPSELEDGGRPAVEFLKVDAQGADFEVVQSAGKHLRRIGAFIVEVQLEPLYLDAKNESDYIDYFTQRGFELVQKKKAESPRRKYAVPKSPFPIIRKNSLG